MYYQCIKTKVLISCAVTSTSVVSRANFRSKVFRCYNVILAKDDHTVTSKIHLNLHVQHEETVAAPRPL